MSWPGNLDDPILHGSKRAREGWEEAFGFMRIKGDDRLLDGDSQVPTRWDEDEWQW